MHNRDGSWRPAINVHGCVRSHLFLNWQVLQVDLFWIYLTKDVLTVQVTKLLLEPSYAQIGIICCGAFISAVPFLFFKCEF